MTPSASNPAATPSGPISAILFTGRVGADLGMPNELLPLLGRSMLQRSVEALVRSGCRHIHVVLGDEPRPTRRLLDDGARWGCDLEYHSVNLREPLGMLFRRLRPISCCNRPSRRLIPGSPMSAGPAPPRAGADGGNSTATGSHNSPR